MSKDLNKIIAELKAENAELKEKLDEAKARRAKKRANLRYRRTEKPVDAKDKLAPQQQCLLQGLPTDRFVDVEEWGKLAVEVGGLSTKQEPWKIANYYTNYQPKPLVGLGYVEIEQVSDEQSQ